jgi:hypothetical protein
METVRRNNLSHPAGRSWDDQTNQLLATNRHEEKSGTGAKEVANPNHCFIALLSAGVSVVIRSQK